MTQKTENKCSNKMHGASIFYIQITEIGNNLKIACKCTFAACSLQLQSNYTRRI